MAEVYHIKIKKQYAAALLDDLIKVNAIENMEMDNSKIPQWQKDALDKEMQIVADDPNSTTPWVEIMNRFKKPE